jgi:hypothetical protein
LIGGKRCIVLYWEEDRGVITPALPLLDDLVFMSRKNQKQSVR